MKFVLNGCHISFVAEAPNDMTLEQLIKQCDKIRPYCCACGICSLEAAEWPADTNVDIIIGYNSVEKVSKDVDCSIK